MNPTAEDYAAITNLLAGYCLALDHDEVDRCVGLFTEDGSFEVYGRTFAGHDALRQMMTAAPGGLHLGGPPEVQMVDQNRARVRQNLLFVERASGEWRRTLYTDELHRTDDGWRIGKRRCQFIVASGISDRPDRG